MMSVALEPLGDHPFQTEFDGEGCRPSRERNAVRDAEHVGVHADRRVAVHAVQHDVRRLSAHAW